MRVGLTYDLREDSLAEAGHGLSEREVAEFDRADTIEALEGAIRAAGFETERIGSASRLMERLVRGDRWDLVFNIAESRRGFGRESLVPAVLEHHAIPYTFSDPLTCAVTLHKGTAKRILRDCSIPTPEFAVVASAEDIHTVRLPYPLFAKPVAEGSSKGVEARSRARNPAELERVCMELIERYRQPALVEVFLPGREFTVGVLGTGSMARVAAVMEVSLREGAEAEIYTYANKEECETRVRYSLATGAIAEEAERLALETWRALGCRDGGRVDVRADGAGRLLVLEVNPLPGLHPEHSDLPIMVGLAGGSYESLIGEILRSAMERVETGSGKRAPCAS